MGHRPAASPTPLSWSTAREGEAPAVGERRVGVLAVQGDFLEHLLAFRRLGVGASEVRLPRDLEGLHALVIPGGESTSMARLLDLYGLRQPIRERVRAGMAAWGTCAGLILMARELREDRPEPLGLMDIGVARNAYGRQVDSFETDLDVPALGPEPYHAVFIRAPRVLWVADGVETLARLPDGTPVAARQGGILVSAFHPELTGDTRLHSYFLSMVAATAEARR